LTSNVVGATAVGPAGGEILGFLAVAVHAEVPVATLRSMIYAYPTFHRAIETALLSLAVIAVPGASGVVADKAISRGGGFGLKLMQPANGSVAAATSKARTGFFITSSACNRVIWVRRSGRPRRPD
jgi:hypothetical protein